MSKNIKNDNMRFSQLKRYFEGPLKGIVSGCLDCCVEKDSEGSIHLIWVKDVFHANELINKHVFC
jgi:hypothetical protein